MNRSSERENIVTNDAPIGSDHNREQEQARRLILLADAAESLVATRRGGTIPSLLSSKDDLVTIEELKADQLDLTAQMVIEARRRLTRLGRKRGSHADLDAVGEKLEDRLDEVDGFPTTQWLLWHPLVEYQRRREAFFYAVKRYLDSLDENDRSDNWYDTESKPDARNIETAAAKLAELLRSQASRLRAVEGTPLQRRAALNKLAHELGPFVAQTLLGASGVDEAHEALVFLNAALSRLGVDVLPDELKMVSEDDLKAAKRGAAAKAHPDANVDQPASVREQLNDHLKTIFTLIDLLRKALALSKMD